MAAGGIFSLVLRWWSGGIFDIITVRLDRPVENVEHRLHCRILSSVTPTVRCV